MVGSIEADITQFAVGQGGFMVGRIRRTGQDALREFTYAFDCGSINREHFEKGLDACDLSRLDVLFISHLDVDHVNGIDALASKMQIDCVVLPCLDALQSIAVACEGAEGAGVRVSVASLLRDPVAWFGERGVSSVYFVERDTSGEGPDAPDAPPGLSPPDAPRPGGNGRWHKPRDGEGERFAYSITGERQSAVEQVKTSRGKVEYTTFGGDVQVDVEITASALTSAPLTWTLIPYVHPFSKTTLDLFVLAASGVLKKKVSTGTGLPAKSFTKQLLAVLLDETSRKELKACYAMLTYDNNRPSMSLYSGPAKPLHPARILRNVISDGGEHFWHPRYSQDMEHCAWLSTGDADLGSLQTRTPWLTRYQRFLREVAVFVLPHHGSNRHVHDDVLGHMPSSLMVACADTKRKKHPHPDLRKRLVLLGQSIAQVSERQPSELTLQVKLFE